MVPACREHGRLSHEGKKSLAAGLNKLKRNESLQLRKENMLRKITSQKAALKTEICQTFARLGQACQQDCIGMLNTRCNGMICHRVFAVRYIV